MVHFQKITEENFRRVLAVDPGDGGRFTASVAVSLAQAWLYYENHDVYSFAVYDGGTLVGFMQLDEELEERCMCLWRVMIDVSHQGRGLGTAAVEQLIALVRESGKYDCIELGCNPENVCAMHIYEKLGFRPAGPVEEGELPMRLDV